MRRVGRPKAGDGNDGISIVSPVGSGPAYWAARLRRDHPDAVFDESVRGNTTGRRSRLAARKATRTQPKTKRTNCPLRKPPSVLPRNTASMRRPFVRTGVCPSPTPTGATSNRNHGSDLPASVPHAHGRDFFKVQSAPCFPVRPPRPRARQKLIPLKSGELRPSPTPTGATTIRQGRTSILLVRPPRPRARHWKVSGETSIAVPQGGACPGAGGERTMDST